MLIIYNAPHAAIKPIRFWLTLFIQPCPSLDQSLFIWLWETWEDYWKCHPSDNLQTRPESEICTNNPCVLHLENNVDNRQDRQYGWLCVTMQCTHRHYHNIDTYLFIQFWALLILFLFQVRIPVPVSEDCPVELRAKDKIAFVIWLLQSQSLFISSYFTCHILDSCNINTNINIKWKNTN